MKPIEYLVACVIMALIVACVLLTQPAHARESHAWLVPPSDWACEQAETDEQPDEWIAKGAPLWSWEATESSWQAPIYGGGLYVAGYNELYNSDGPSRTMPGWHDGYLETYYNASGHYLANTWTLDAEGFYHDADGRYVIGVDVSHMAEMPYGTVVETGKGEAAVYDYGSGAEVHDFATSW